MIVYQYRSDVEKIFEKQTRIIKLYFSKNNIWKREENDCCLLADVKNKEKDGRKYNLTEYNTNYDNKVWRSFLRKVKIVE